MKSRNSVVWIATKDGVDTVFRDKCPDAFVRATYDNVMPYVEKTELNLARARITQLEAEVEELMKVDYWQDRHDIVKKENAKLAAFLKQAYGLVCEHLHYFPDQGDVNPPPFVEEIEKVLNLKPDSPKS